MKTTAEPRTQTKGLRAIVQLLIVGVCVLAFSVTALCLCLTLVTDKLDGNRDFVVYWATGEQLVHHGNPYDANALSRIERGAGMPARYTVSFMRNPPWALPLAFPLGLLSLRTASLLGVLLLLTCLAVSVHLLWQMHGCPQNYLHLLGYTFGPALICLILGQTSLFALLGLVLFLRLHHTCPFIAGMSLWLCALKPHLFLPFVAVLVAWIFVSKSYKIVAGAAVALVASGAITYFIDPLAAIQYLQMARSSGVERQSIPNLSIVLTHWLSPHTVWLQFLPATLGSIWALIYFWPRRKTWNWLEHGSPLMLVSILAAPYSFLNDEVLVIPALLDGAYRTSSWNLLAMIAFASALTEIAFFCEIMYTSASYISTLWTAPVWLAWYLLASRTVRESEMSDLSAS